MGHRDEWDKSRYYYCPVCGRALIKHFDPECPDCGSEMLGYEEYKEKTDLTPCPNCGCGFKGEAGVSIHQSKMKCGVER